uniref:Uncharacterized protein n=1 Tax=Glossina austeni TaxID=7395 RepID=A0A1A9V4R9_GLOAU
MYYVSRRDELGNGDISSLNILFTLKTKGAQLALQHVLFEQTTRSKAPANLLIIALLISCQSIIARFVLQGQAKVDYFSIDLQQRTKASTSHEANRKTYHLSLVGQYFYS